MMSIPSDALEPLLGGRVFTLDTPFGDVLSGFTEQASTTPHYAVVAIDPGMYAVLTMLDMETVHLQRGATVMPMPLGEIPELRNYFLFAELPVTSDTRRTSELRTIINRLHRNQRLVVVNTQGDVLGVLTARSRQAVEALDSSGYASGHASRHPSRPAAAATPGEPATPADAAVPALPSEEIAHLNNLPPPTLQMPALPHLITRFDGLEPDQALPASQHRVLRIWVGSQVAGGSSQSTRPFAFRFEAGQQQAIFRVLVAGNPDMWQIMPLNPAMQLVPPGETGLPAEFVVYARKPGHTMLYITLEQTTTGAVVQHVWLPVQVGPPLRPGAPPPAAPVLPATTISLPLHSAALRRRTVQLALRADDGLLELHVRADLPDQPRQATYRLPVRTTMLQQATAALRQRLQAIIDSTTRQPTPPDPVASRTTLTIEAERARALYVPLAAMGQQVWALLFQSPDTPPGLRTLADDMRRLAPGSSLQVVLEQQHMLLPWALLYDKPGELTPDTLDWAGFWGYRYLLDVLPPGNYATPAIAAAPPRFQTLLSDASDVQSFAQVQERFLHDHLHRVETSTAHGNAAVQQALLRAPNDATLLYLFCQGKQLGGLPDFGGLPDESALLFGEPPALRLSDLQRLPVAPLREQALVVLNVCQGAAGAAFAAETFLPFFLHQLGARGFVGSDVALPPLFAHDFGLRFLEAFARGEAVGAILWRLRRHYLATHQNILAFSYTLYGTGDMQLA